jgi:hypothetical protein
MLGFSLSYWVSGPQAQMLDLCVTNINIEKHQEEHSIDHKRYIQDYVFSAPDIITFLIV